MTLESRLVSLTETEKLKTTMRVLTIALKEVHDFFFEKGFYQLMPIILSPITDPLGPDPGSSVVKTGEIEYQGQTLRLTQSMILHKQYAIGLGLEKFYIISPNIRLESAWRKESGKHAFEFSQIDFEIFHGSMTQVFALVEELLRRVRTRLEITASEELSLLGRSLPPWDKGFKVFTSHELEAQYGEDWELKASLDMRTPFWVVCHDREFYDKKDWSREGDHFLNYDLIYPEGFGEALSGAEREFEYELLKRRIEEDKFSLDKYRAYLDLAKQGKLKPSAGGGLGVERMIRYFTGTKHIRDVQVFKRIPGEKVVL